MLHLFLMPGTSMKIKFDILIKQLKLSFQAIKIQFNKTGGCTDIDFLRFRHFTGPGEMTVGDAHRICWFYIRSN